MAIHKFVLDDFVEENSYTLLGIHSTLNDYRLAFLLNKQLEIKLKRKPENIEINKKSSFSFFEWNNKTKGITWNLVSNISKTNNKAKTDLSSLFNENDIVTKTNYLIPEQKKVNYFLKINSESGKYNEQVTLSRIIKIPQIITAYSLNANTLKSKDNLIFN